MKTMMGISKKLTMLCVASLVLFSACHKDDDNPNQNMYTISGNANGASMVPSVTGTGTGAISGTYNADTRVLNYNTTWNGLTGAPMSGGFYNGATGSNGAAAGSAWNFGTNPTATGSTSGQMTLTQEQATQLRGGNWYYTMGTTAHTGGEVRGQITTTLQQ